MKRLTPSQAREGFEKAKTLIATGKSISEACKEASISAPTYYYYRAREAGATPKEAMNRKNGSKRKYNKTSTFQVVAAPTKQPSFVDVPLKQASKGIAVVICQPNQLQEVLEQLQ